MNMVIDVDIMKRKTINVDGMMIATSQPILCAVSVVEVLLPSAKAATHLDFLQRKTV